MDQQIREVDMRQSRTDAHLYFRDQHQCSDLRGLGATLEGHLHESGTNLRIYVHRRSLLTQVTLRQPAHPGVRVRLVQLNSLRRYYLSTREEP